MRGIISEAIKNRNLVQFTYKGHKRIVEPHLLGKKTSGNDALSAWQVGGYESNDYPRWHPYLLEKIRDL